MLHFNEFINLPEIDLIIIKSNSVEILNEGQWVSGSFNRNIRIDQPTNGVGQKHAHVYGRKGGQIGVVNFDGSSSHNTTCKLKSNDANVLRDKGFKIPSSNIVEWCICAIQPTLLLS